MHTAAGAEQFSVACRDLHRIARINSEAVDVCVGLYADQPDEESAAMVADSLAMALRQVAFLTTPLQMLALDLECESALQID